MATQQRTRQLRNSAQAFCKAFLSPPAPDILLSTYFTPTPKITEHGPAWATEHLPFLGKTFEGSEACASYFALLGDVLEVQLPPDAFPASEDGYVVDVDADGGRGVVSVKGKGRFVSKKTGKGWKEEFVYRLSGFDSEGRIGWWEVWADPLSAWVAVRGEETK